MAKKKEEESVKKSEKKSDAPSKDERAAALLADVNKKLRGRATLMSSSDYNLPWMHKRLPTGLLQLDLALGGGWPAGGLSQIIGRRSAGKSYLVWSTIRQLQHILGNSMKVLLAITEGSADRSQAKLAGVKISMGDDTIKEMNAARISKGWPPFTKEEIADLKYQIGTIDEMRAVAAEDFFDIILRSIDEDIYDLIVIDSIGGVLSSAEQENESIHDKTYGGISAPNSTFLKKMQNLLGMRNDYGEVRDTCVIGVNQVRDDIKNPNAPYRAPGGNVLEHTKLVDLYVESGAALGYEDKVPTVTGEGVKMGQRFVQTGKGINWKIVKGKAGIHEGSRGTYIYDFRTNAADYYTDTLLAGVTNGIIDASGAWYTILGPEGQQLARAQGRDKMIEILTADSQKKAGTDEITFMDYIREACFRKSGINISYDWD